MTTERNAERLDMLRDTSGPPVVRINADEGGCGMSEPTRAAMRAAAYINDTRPPYETAEIIDRETALPELIAALREIVAAYDLESSGIKTIACRALRKAGEL